MKPEATLEFALKLETDDPLAHVLADLGAAWGCRFRETDHPAVFAAEVLWFLIEVTDAGDGKFTMFGFTKPTMGLPADDISCWVQRHLELAAVRDWAVAT